MSESTNWKWISSPSVHERDLVEELRVKGEERAAEMFKNYVEELNFKHAEKVMLEAQVKFLNVQNARLKDELKRLRIEKVAGGHAESVPEEVESFPQTPATDPTSSVCEWTDSGGMLWATNCGQSYGAFVSRFGKDAYCPHCDKIIKFSWRPRNEPVAAY